MGGAEIGHEAGDAVHRELPAGQRDACGPGALGVPQGRPDLGQRGFGETAVDSTYGQGITFEVQLECGARLHKLRVYETLDSSDATGREVCGYLLVRGGVHAHAYALALKKLTGVSIEQMLPTPNIPTDRIPECQKYLAEGSHRRLYTFSPSDYRSIAGIWEGEMALPDDPPGELQVVEGMPEGGRIHDLVGQPSAFTPDYAPEEFYEIAQRLTQKAHQGGGSL